MKITISLFLSFAFSSVANLMAQETVNMKKYSAIAFTEANKLILEKKGILNSRVSLLPTIEIYELEDGSAVVINKMSSTADLYFRAEDLIRTRGQRPSKDQMERFQGELQNFPDNVFEILQGLSQKLGVAIDVLNLNKNYLDSISEAVKSFSKHEAADSLYLDLCVYLGELYIQKNKGSWQKGTVGNGVPNLIQPILLDSSDKENQFLFKMVNDGLDDVGTFDWYLMVLFWTNDARNKIHVVN